MRFRVSNNEIGKLQVTTNYNSKHSYLRKLKDPILRRLKDVGLEVFMRESFEKEDAFSLVILEMAELSEESSDSDLTAGQSVSFELFNQMLMPVPDMGEKI